MKKDVAILVIGYKESLLPSEIMSFESCLVSFRNRDIFVITKQNMPTIDYRMVCSKNKVDVNFISVEDHWFNSISDYSKLLLQKEFYETFNDYEYVLIYQLDCFAFKDRLDYFIGLGYNYYGAAWNYQNVYNVVGNGGFSLRKVSAFIKNIEERKDMDYINDSNVSVIEDMAFCNGFYRIDNICPFEVAEKFALETTAIYKDPSTMTIDDFPVGIHGFPKPEFRGCMEKMIKRWLELNCN